jgi:YD repeat-containing protein
MKLTEIESTLSAQVLYTYDEEGDLLEIVFRQGEATCAVELTDSIILRFDLDTSEPLSLSLISFSRLIQSADYDVQYFRLLTDEWPEELQEKVMLMLRSTPLNEFLQVGSYTPPHTRQVIPLATVKRPYLLAQAA